MNRFEAREPVTPGIHGSAMVLVEDERSALAAVLLLQEMGYAVDIAGTADAALSWVRLARYDWIVCSGGGDHSRSVEFVRQLRYSAPGARILVVGGPDEPRDDVAELGVEVLRPPVDANMLIERFAQVA